jgi:IS4 transposase
MARKLYAQDDFGLDLEQVVYVLDSTTIDLCLSLFPWAKFRKTKGAVKLHTLLDLRGNIPSLIIITHGKVSDVSILDHIPLEAGAFYILDRGYMDFARLYRIHQAGAFFITRAKKNFDHQRIYSHPIEKSTGLRSDQTVRLKGYYTHRNYPERLRRISYFDAENSKRFVFLTNQFHLPALTIAQLYKCRWQIELFFKWIKQHLRIKTFYGTSENAVKTQIWIAISVYVLVAIIKKTLRLEQSIYTILQILSISLFEKAPIYQLLTQHDYQKTEATDCIQLNLFDY